MGQRDGDAIMLKMVCDWNDMASKTPFPGVDRASTLSANPPHPSLIEDATQAICGARSLSDVDGKTRR